MGVDTKGYLNAEITAKQIYDVIVKLFDENAEFEVKESNPKDWHNACGFIGFNYNGEFRNMFVIENCLEDSEQSTPFESDRHCYISLSKYGDAIKIITTICSVFGGYIDEDDCDDVTAWETYIKQDAEFNVDNHITKQNEIIDILDGDMKMSDKIRIAKQIMKHSDKIKELI